MRRGIRNEPGGTEGHGGRKVPEIPIWSTPLRAPPRSLCLRVEILSAPQQERWWLPDRWEPAGGWSFEFEREKFSPGSGRGRFENCRETGTESFRIYSKTLEARGAGR